MTRPTIFRPVTPGRRSSSMRAPGRSSASTPRPAGGASCSEGAEPPRLLSSAGVSGFFRVHGQLTCDGVPLSKIAEAVGTPVYVYSRAAIEEKFRRFDAAFAPVPHLVCYATKANSNLAVLSVLSALGAGA